jgi:hypothetical protein
MCKRITVLGLAVVLAGLVMAGCSSNDSTPPPSSTAKIRVVHTSPDAGPIDVYIGTSVTPWLEDIPYAMASTYLSRSSGTITLVIRQAGADPATDPGIESDPISMASGASLTVVAAGLVNSQDDQDKFRLITYNDTFQNSPSARARVVHTGSDAPTLTVSVGATGQILAANLARWADSGQGGNVYEAGEAQDIVVQAEDNQIKTFRAPELEPQKVYYFFLVGQISSTSPTTKVFDLLIVGPGGVVPLERTESREVRVIHVAPDLGPVDCYIAWGMGIHFYRTMMQDNMAYGGVAVYGPLFIRQVNIEMYSVGADPDQTEPLVSESVYIHDEAPSTTAFAAGLAGSVEPDDEFRMFSVADSFATPPAGMTQARVVHTAVNLAELGVKFGDDPRFEAVMDRFEANPEGSFSLTADTGLAMEVYEGTSSILVDEFTTPQMPSDKQNYLVLTGIKDGSPGFSLLWVTQDGAQGFTAPD